MSKPTKKRWKGCSVEEEFFGEERKKGKAQRKIVTSTDRSQYKKTDQDKIKKRALLIQEVLDKDQDHLWRGRVLSVVSQGIIVSYEGKNFLCELKGLLKKDKTQHKNLVTVGDWVRFQELAPNQGQIISVEARSTVLSRADNLSRRKVQLIAANIDQVLITVSVVSPQLKPSIVDRYIIATEKGGMQPIIVINKIDLLKSKTEDPFILQETEMYEEFVRAYSAAGIPLISVSADTGEGIEALREVMTNKSSVFSGQSGVGKSSLITAITGLDLKVGPIVDKTQKGAHTTSNASLLPLEFGGWCIDTPGIKSFGVWDLQKDEIESYFTEIHAYGLQCKFPDCTHAHEEDCAVQQAVDAGDLSPVRYDSYQALMSSVNEVHVRR